METPVRPLLGKVAIVTGGASGIGAASVRELAAQGARVMLTDIDPAGADVATAVGEQVAFEQQDVSVEADWKRIVAATERRFGTIAILVNNAGIIAPGNNEGPIEDLDIELFRRVVEVNQIGTILGIKTTVPSMRRGGGGSIINISSAGGLVGTPFTNAYSSTKWAVVGMTKCCAIELGRDNIRVNSVHPGAIWTPIHHSGQSSEQAQKTRFWVESVVQHLPLPRIAEPEEVARMIAFLAGDGAGYSTGSQFVVDGGLTSM